MSALAKVVLIGDSIRLGYQPLVQEKLKNKAVVWGTKENCRHSLWALEHFTDWVESQRPDLVHFNFGIHDVYELSHGKNQIIIEQYELCLRRFIDKVKTINAKMIWATTTPLFQPDKSLPMKDWKKRHNRIEEYNNAALAIANEEKIPVNDLYKVIMDNDYLKCISLDGCHMDEFGNEVLSDAVAKIILEKL